MYIGERKSWIYLRLIATNLRQLCIYNERHYEKDMQQVRKRKTLKRVQ